jgi:hypothetical protein
MRRPWAAPLLAALAACTGGAAGNDAVAADPGLALWRQDVLRGCVGGGRERVRDPNVPVERHCACAADRVMAGKTLAQLEADERSGDHAAIFTAALRRCIAEISPDYRAGQGA